VGRRLIDILLAESDGSRSETPGFTVAVVVFIVGRQRKDNLSQMPTAEDVTLTLVQISM
jgi:hypothetical protein